MAEQAGKRKNGVEKTRQKMTAVFHQAKESLKIFQTLEKETLEKAKSFVKFPSAPERRRLTNARILDSLKKLGVATRAEVDSLETRIQKLELSLGTFLKQNSPGQATTPENVE